MEDVDRDREIPGAADSLLKTLRKFGFDWPEPVWRQSERAAAYESALDQLQAAGRLFVCRCGRGDYQGAYRGTCRTSGRLNPGDARPGVGAALRVETSGAGVLHWQDDLQGPQSQDLEKEVGDFVVRRKDGYHAYQLAVVVDDAAQGITHVVRGMDLLDNTPRQRYLQRLLGLPAPAYAHVPLVIEEDGRKLAKSRSSVAVARLEPAQAVVTALELLLQSPPAGLAAQGLEAAWAWALENWTPAALHGVRCVTAAGVYHRHGGDAGTAGGQGQG